MSVCRVLQVHTYHIILCAFNLLLVLFLAVLCEVVINVCSPKASKVFLVELSPSNCCTNFKSTVYVRLFNLSRLSVKRPQVASRCVLKTDGCTQDVVCWHRWQWETKRHLGAWRQVRLARVTHLVSNRNQTSARRHILRQPSVVFTFGVRCCLVWLCSGSVGSISTHTACSPTFSAQWSQCHLCDIRKRNDCKCWKKKKRVQPHWNKAAVAWCHKDV